MKQPRRHSAAFNAVLAAASAALLMSTLTTSSGAASKPRSLASLTLPALTGFNSDKTDQTGGGPTGSINFNEASSADCNVSSSNRRTWVASEMRYFDNDAAEPETYLILCVTQFKSAGAAVANRKSLIGEGGSKPLTSVPIPGAFLHVVGPAYLLYFAKGDYFVFVASVNLTAVTKGLSLGTNVAHREFLRLPK